MTDLITIVGTAGTRPELTTTPKGTTVASFRLASNLRRRDAASGAWVDAGTNWYSVNVWGVLAEHVCASLSAGEPVIVHGRLRIVQWGDGERKGTAVEIDAETVGHSLRFGTATFQKSHPRAETATGAGARNEVSAAHGAHPDPSFVDATATSTLAATPF